VAHTIILATQEAKKSGGLQFEASPDKEFKRPYLKKKITKIGLVE
jgi:hypothetical protein